MNTNEQCDNETEILKCENCFIENETVIPRINHIPPEYEGDVDYIDESFLCQKCQDLIEKEEKLKKIPSEELKKMFVCYTCEKCGKFYSDYDQGELGIERMKKHIPNLCQDCVFGLCADKYIGES